MIYSLWCINATFHITMLWTAENKNEGAQSVMFIFKYFRVNTLDYIHIQANRNVHTMALLESSWNTWYTQKEIHVMMLNPWNQNVALY